MSLVVGDLVPDIHTRSDDGQMIDLTALRGQWVVVYFYPRANTPGCSTEAQRFEMALPEFRRYNAEVIGISTDTEARQASFRDSCNLSFPLLPDSDKHIARAYGVLRGVGGMLGLAARQTFLIAPDGKLAYQWRSVNPMTHAAEVLEVLGRLTAQAAASGQGQL